MPVMGFVNKPKRSMKQVFVNKPRKGFHANDGSESYSGIEQEFH